MASFLLRSLSAILAGLALGALAPVAAQPMPASGYVARALDGDNLVSDHFALAPGANANSWAGFFYFGDEQRLYGASCSGLTCSLGRPLTGSGERGRFVSVAARPMVFSRPIVAYYNGTDADLMLIACGDSACANGGIERTLDSAGDVGAGTAIAVDPATGFAAVAYYDTTNTSLKVYRCAAADCATGSAVTADALGTDRGRNPSIAFASGALWVAYDDTTSGEVRLAFALPPFNSFTGTALGMGTDATITVDSNGLIDLAYRGLPGSTLQRVRCNNAACSSFGAQQLAIAGRGFAPSATRLANGNLLVSHQEAATGTVLATACNDAACSAPVVAPMDVGSGFGSTSVALTTGSSQPLVLYHDGTRADVRAAQCTTPACTAFQRGVAVNGVMARAPRIALRTDGRAVMTWQRTGFGFQTAIATCNDVLCTAPVRRQLIGANGDNSSRPAIAIRPNGRPFVFFSQVGGTGAFDCADAECLSGTERSISGTGNGTSQSTELALRGDGRPVPVYFRASTADVFAFVCADADCTSGTERLLVNEPDQSVESTSLSNFGAVMTGGNRLAVVYARSRQPTPGNFVSDTRFVRCDDPDCTSATVRTVNTTQTFFATPIALRSDGRPAFVEFGSGGQSLAICDNADCTGVGRFPLVGQDLHYGLGLRPGDIPVFDGGTSGSIGAWICSDASCGSASRSLLATAPVVTRSLTGPLVLNAAGQPVVAIEESEVADVFLLAPLPDSIFASSFEP